MACWTPTHRDRQGASPWPWSFRRCRCRWTASSPIPPTRVGPLFDWYANGEVEVPTAVPERWTFRTSEASAGYLRESMGRIGALVAGRRLFDIGRWGEHGHPYGVPVFVVTHESCRDGRARTRRCRSPSSPTGSNMPWRRPRRPPGRAGSAWPGPTSPSSAWTPACSTRCGSTWCPSCSARASATSTSSRTRRSHWRIHGSSRALASPISSTASPGSSARRSMTRSAQALRAGPPVARQLGRAPRVAVGESDSAGVGSAPLSLAEVLVGQAAPDLLDLAAGRARHPFLADVHGLADLIGQPLHPRVVQECPRRLHDLLVALTTSLGPEHVSGAEADQQA